MRRLLIYYLFERFTPILTHTGLVFRMTQVHILLKHSSYTAQAQFIYCSSIAHILLKHSSYTAQAQFTYCSSIVHILLKYSSYTAQAFFKCSRTKARTKVQNILSLNVHSFLLTHYEFFSCNFSQQAEYIFFWHSQHSLEESFSRNVLYTSKQQGRNLLADWVEMVKDFLSLLESV